MGVFLPSLDQRRSQQRAQLPGWAAITLGYLALAASFGGVMALAAPETRAALAHATPAPVLALMAGLPLLAHTGMMLFWSRRTGVSVQFTTTLDGLLLQAYFTGASSFLPLSSDAELEGDRRSKAKCAGAVLVGMIALHAALGLVGDLTGLDLVTQLSSLFLVYAFVFAFPLQPLDGGDIWAESRWAWLAVWLLVLFFFLGRLPEAYYAIL